MSGFGARDEGGDGEPEYDPVRRADLLRSRGETPQPERARFADRVARAISAPSGGRVPLSRRPRFEAVERPPASDGDAEVGTDPSAVQVVTRPEQDSGPRPLDPEVGARDAAFGSGTLPPVGMPVGGVEVVPLPSAPAVVCDAARRILRANPAFSQLTGMPIGAALGMPLDRVLAGPDADARLRRPSGSVRVRVVRWDLPGALHAVLFVELAEPDPRWTSELERLARVGTWGYDLSTATLRRSPSLDRLYADLGVRPDGPLGPLEGDQVALLCRGLRSGTVPPEHRVELRVTGDRVLSCRARVERGPDGAPLRLAGMVRDVTAERRMNHAGERFATLMSTVAEGVALFDAAGRLVDANAAFSTLLGRGLDGLRGTTALALTADGAAQPDTGPAELPTWLRRIAPGGPGYRLDAVTLLRGDGLPVTCRVGVSASTSDSGDPFWLVTTAAPERRALPVAVGEDELTGLLDRAGALSLLAQLLAGAGRTRVAVVCGDLDDFARVNSSLGHEAGDDLLVDTAERLRRGLPGACTAARLSADRFAVLCSDHALTDGPDALARTVAGLLRASVPVHGTSVRITASVGVVTPEVLPSDEPVAADLLRYAEVALAHAKREGRGAIVTASTSVIAAADRQLEIEAELRAALDADALTCEYQPVVGPDGTVLSAEALVRWPHPDRGMIGPGEFLPVAERAGMMRELDVWVLRTATAAAATWPTPASVAVNLAGLLPGDPAFLDEVTAAVDAAGLSWNRLVLELVETGLVALPQAALDAMAVLVERGVRFAVDDFGTGYSSLARLKELPTQTVKVDRAFVTGVATDPADFAVARAVVDMARALGRTTVAEGVETAEQFHVLRGLGVDAYQGWLFARPLALDDLRRTLAAGRLATPARALGA